MWDIFNKEKLAAVEERLREVNREKEELRKNLTDEIERLKHELAGDRVCGIHCSQCENGYTGYSSGVSTHPSFWKCRLDIKCKDFKEKE